THERLVLDGAQDDTGSVHLALGATFVWRAHPGAVLALEGDGALPLWLTALDPGGHVLRAEALEDGAPFARQLPAGAALIAVSCAAQRFADDGAGWHGGSPLAQLGPSALLGENCVVRSPAPHPVHQRPRRGTRGVGVTSGRTLV